METKSDPADLKPCYRAAPPGGPPSAPPTQARRALFNPPTSHLPVRRAKSEGHARADGAVAGPLQSAVPEVCTDATMNDRLWSKLEPGSHRDSMSSSSSVSSNDTVIDLSLPNLARRSLCILPGPSGSSCRRSAPISCDSLRVGKSKSNPNLQQSPKDELKPRPLQPAQDGSEDPPGRLTERRHTWCRLYMEGLRQASTKRPSSPSPTSAATALMSKSLGDLTSDDISCSFDSKYRSISRSFVVRSSRDQVRKGSSLRSRPQSDLTEQLRRLTDVEPLSPSDFSPENTSKDSQEDSPDETLLRRTSSRSQSRVRYIANRAKKAQERQRLQGLSQGRSASFSLTGSSGSSPIEERGIPEGACCVDRSPCSSLDLLTRQPPLESPPDLENSELFFMLKL
uniref:Phospholipase C, eta 2a n=1 Tax=Iconisemion striatum TaxID=60296 RepID=A0A1A7WDY1_9TELE